MRFPSTYWMFAKEWIDVQRLQRISTMSRKLAGGSKKEHQKLERVTSQKSRSRNLVLVVVGLFFAVGAVDLSQDKKSHLLQIIGPESDLESFGVAFASLKSLPGPGTAARGHFMTSPKSPMDMGNRGHSNGLQE
jgi:hypothetical protein